MCTVAMVSVADDEAAIEALKPILGDGWSIATGLSLMVWFIYAPQCVAMLAAVKREAGGARHVVIVTAYLFALAYLASFITFQVASALA